MTISSTTRSLGAVGSLGTTGNETAMIAVDRDLEYGNESE